MDSKLLARVMIVCIVGIAAAAPLLIASRADAASRAVINGVKYEECSDFKIAWAMFKAAQEPGGIKSATVTRPAKEDPFVQACLAKRPQRATKPKNS